MASAQNPRRIRCVYQPLWDVQRGALTTYLCAAEESPAEPAGVFRDLRVLRAVLDELQAMAADGRKFLVVCPVQHETLYRHESFFQFKALCEAVPAAQRAMLVFMVTAMRRDYMRMNGGWFLPALDALGKYVFVDLPFHEHSEFLPLRQYRVDAAGFRLGRAEEGRRTPFEMVHSCAAKAQALGISRCFALDVNTLSVATAAACNGVSLIGGDAVHGAVAAPDSMYRYRHENLFAQLAVPPQPPSQPETSI